MRNIITTVISLMSFKQIFISHDIKILKGLNNSFRRKNYIQYLYLIFLGAITLLGTVLYFYPIGSTIPKFYDYLKTSSVNIRYFI